MEGLEVRVGEFLVPDLQGCLKSPHVSSDLQLRQDLAAGQAQAQRDPLPPSTVADPSDVIHLPSEEDEGDDEEEEEEDIGRVDAAPQQPPHTAAAANIVFGG